MKTNTEKFLEGWRRRGLRDQLAEVPREADRDDGKGDDASPPPIDIDAIRRKLGPRKPIHWFGGLPSRGRGRRRRASVRGRTAVRTGRGG